jgi:DNA polymerase-3 subunit delta'
MLIGHLDQQRAFLDAWNSRRLHHAWLLAGPQGIGKASFARAAATYALATAAGPGDGIASDRLHVAPEHRVAHYIEAGSHPDLRVLARAVDDKGKVAANIRVAQVRELAPLLATKPGLSDWRAVIVDAIDDLNKEAANALLKSLEEPPRNTLFLLVSHAPGRLLPTIRSRCRMLRFQPLGPAEVAEVLAQALPDAAAADRAALAPLADGSPGRAMRFAGLDVAGLAAALDALATAPPPRRQPLALDLSRQLAAKAAQPRYEAFLELAPAWLAARARDRTGAPLAKLIELWEKAHQLAGQAVPLALDPQSVTFELANLVASVDA